MVFAIISPMFIDGLLAKWPTTHTSIPFAKTVGLSIQKFNFDF
jgi:hypothetical protein